MKFYCLLVSIVLLIAIPQQSDSSLIQEMGKVNLTVAMRNWQYDLGVMFYAPWCPYCKQFTPFWEEMAELLEWRGNIRLTRFNCELSFEGHTDLCQEMGVDSYPSLYFIGYGDFYQSGSYRPNVVKFKTDIYPDAILIWLRMLNTISTYQQKWDVFRSLLPFSSHKTLISQQHATVIKEIEELQSRLDEMKQVEEREKRRKLFDNEVDKGDVFPLLNSINPDDERNYPLRLCASDYTMEYCRNEDPAEEEYCGMIGHCAQRNMKPVKCRPPTCPFKNRLGCKVLSNCLDIDVIELFKSAIAASKELSSRDSQQ